MQVHCKYDALVPVSELKPNSRNRNHHPPEQIARLTKLLAYQGIRAPIVVSSLSGQIAKGHGTLAAIKANGWAEAPVVYQTFADEAQEYAFVQSDNAVASWAELDLSGINTDLGDLGPDFDLELLGLRYFNLDPLFEAEEDKPDADEKRHRIELEFPDEEALMEIYVELSGRGYIVKRL